MRDRNDRNKTYWRIAALVLVLGMVSLSLFQFVFAGQIPVRKNCEGAEIEMFRTQLALIPSPNVQERKNVEGKIEAWETMIAICENYIPETPKATPEVSPFTPPPFTTGIFEGQPGAFFHAFEARIENHWMGFVNGEQVIVFAGAWVNDPSQGFIAVMTASSSKRKSIWGYFPSPTKSGALLIVDSRGSCLVIQQANDKKPLFFDVPASSYVASLDAPVEKSTPTQIPITAKPTGLPYPAPLF